MGHSQGRVIHAHSQPGCRLEGCVALAGYTLRPAGAASSHHKRWPVQEGVAAAAGALPPM